MMIVRTFDDPDLDMAPISMRGDDA